MAAKTKTQRSEKKTQIHGESQKVRKRALPKHHSFKLTKKRLSQPKPIPTALALFKKTAGIIGSNKKLFFGIVLVYVALSLILVYGVGGLFDIKGFKDQLDGVFGGDADKFGTTATLFGYLISSVSAKAGETGVYQTFLTVVAALASIWATRQVFAGERPRVRDTFYKGMYPLIPFILLLLVVGIQMMPALLGNFLYSTVINQGLAVTGVEKMIWLLLFLALAALSFYMLCSSVFALYLVTLPDMTPLQALRSARELVLHRRLAVFWRLVALPLVILGLMIIIFVPLLMFATVLAQPLFLLASGLSLVGINVYMYTLYRSLL